MKRAAILMLVMTACAGQSDPVIRVSAAASLTGVFTQMASEYTTTTGIEVDLNFAGSSALREQILEGAPVDVYASADESNMQRVVDAGAATTAQVFATNSLVIAVPAGNPGNVTGLADLERPDLLVGVCADGVPCGDLARALLEAAGVQASVDTNEPDVRALVTKIETGELDAGLVYRTDLGDSLESIAVPAHPPTRYMLASLTDAGGDFVAWVRSERGSEILRAAGFGAP
ncbi:MAG: molybdate ABC transporter substrate-binding protein [Acidimicrobiia bacterium]|nr:molybdate ABC transporter substrate-binding protein [Acidimicrobiia bacterium]MDH5292843.1 molybdate ABC transporter substrate-binding protein [Acidimicrobiia bacterium]